jgi:hypothetical protein
MSTLADLLAAGRNQKTDPRPWDGPGAPAPGASPSPSPTPGAPGAPPDPMAQAMQLAQRNQAVAQGAAPATNALEGAHLGAVPLPDGNVSVPPSVWQQVVQMIKQVTGQ